MRHVEYQMVQSAILIDAEKSECDFQKMATALVVSELQHTEGDEETELPLQLCVFSSTVKTHTVKRRSGDSQPR